MLLKLLAHRFPNIFQTSQVEYLMEKISRPLEGSDVRDRDSDKYVVRKIAAFISENNQASYPLLIGDQYSPEERTEMADFLLRKHFDDYTSSHCTPLPVEYFRLPWELPNDTDFVFT